MSTITVLTYNVHSCRGRDGKASPERIADLIAHFNADIVALQELDVRLLRSGSDDQAKAIADRLNMEFHFLPSFCMEEGEYGNAVLARHPLKVVRAEELPTLPKRYELEKRGALWVEVTIEGRAIQLITTHFGLNRVERSLQADILLGPHWLGSSACSSYCILCGDLNVLAWSKIYRRFSSVMFDAARRLPFRLRSTYPSRFPLFRLDYVFVSSEIQVTDVEVPRTALTALASDHLPVVATLRLR
jgi:endonuclease/exonuclease/phosphatase family metal-dependent hydrolase